LKKLIRNGEVFLYIYDRQLFNLLDELAFLKKTRNALNICLAL